MGSRHAARVEGCIEEPEGNREPGSPCGLPIDLEFFLLCTKALLAESDKAKGGKDVENTTRRQLEQGNQHS